MSYSEYWRVNRSSVESVELANALRGLRKVVGQIGVGAETVWAGLPTGDEPRIELPVFLARKDYPIPPENMDLLTGMSIHEALHIREDSQHAWGYLSQMFPRMGNKASLKKLAEAGEDIHVDGVALKSGILGKYVQKTRAWWRRNINRDFTVGPPSAEGLLGVWADIVLDVIFPVLPAGEIASIRHSFAGKDVGDISSTIETFCHYDLEAIFQIYGILLSMSQAYMEQLEILLLKTPEIIDADAEARALCYLELWGKLKGVFNEWEASKDKTELSQKPPNINVSSEEFEEEEELPPELSAAVAAALRSEAKTITRQIEATLKALGGEQERYCLLPAVFEDSTRPCKVVPHRGLVNRLKEVFRLQQEQASKINHGLRSGKLDARRLYRVPTTGLVFKQREYFPENNQWDITLLLDASSSVTWHWNLMESVYAAIVEALREGSNHLDVLAYKEFGGNCLMSRLFCGNSLFTTSTGGSTPSGEAIIAASLLIPPGSRRLMIHVTDGLWNSGVDVWYALELCKREGTHLVTLGCGESIKALRLQYGENFRLLESIEQLPKAMEDLFRKKLLGRG